MCPKKPRARSPTRSSTSEVDWREFFQQAPHCRLITGGGSPAWFPRRDRLAQLGSARRGGLDGKVVLVDFWIYTCINWLRTLAYVRAWTKKYQDQGLVVVGVHTPEFPFERDIDNVRQAVKDMAVEYPVALDNDYRIWEGFANRFWPAIYIADAEGRIRHHQFGEGGYAECEMVIQRLLGESGRDTVPHDLVSIAPTGLEAQADWASLKSPETYLGYESPNL